MIESTDTHIILKGPAIYDLGEPFSETIEVDEGKTRKRKWPEGVTVVDINGGLLNKKGTEVAELATPVLEEPVEVAPPVEETKPVEQPKKVEPVEEPAVETKPEPTPKIRGPKIEYIPTDNVEITTKIMVGRPLKGRYL